MHWPPLPALKTISRQNKKAKIPSLWLSPQQKNGRNGAKELARDPGWYKGGSVGSLMFTVDLLKIVDCWGVRLHIRKHKSEVGAESLLIPIGLFLNENEDMICDSVLLPLIPTYQLTRLPPPPVAT